MHLLATKWSGSCVNRGDTLRERRLVSYPRPCVLVRTTSLSDEESLAPVVLDVDDRVFAFIRVENYVESTVWVKKLESVPILAFL